MAHYDMGVDEYKKLLRGQKRGNKYNARRVFVDGQSFDSKWEAERYEELRVMQTGGLIDSLKHHPEPYRLEVNGILICTYRPDFVYYDRSADTWVVEDAKSKATLTRSYKLVKRLMKAIHGIDIKETYK